MKNNSKKIKNAPIHSRLLLSMQNSLLWSAIPGTWKCSKFGVKKRAPTQKLSVSTAKRAVSATAFRGAFQFLTADILRTLPRDNTIELRPM